MVKAAAKMDWIDEERIMCEMAVKRLPRRAQIYLHITRKELAKCMDEGESGDDKIRDAVSGSGAVHSGRCQQPGASCGSVGMTPRFYQAGQRTIRDEWDDNRYIDYIGSWGPMILGFIITPRFWKR